MAAPVIVECKIVERLTHYDREYVRPGKPFRFSEILMTDENGVHYCSRTWDVIPDNPFNRAHQIAQFKQRWESSHV
jgi:hypothetical protein